MIFDFIIKGICAIIIGYFMLSIIVLIYSIFYFKTRTTCSDVLYIIMCIIFLIIGVLGWV